MLKRPGRKKLLVGLVVGMSVGGTGAWASTPAAGRVVTGCYYNKTGAVRVINPARTKCVAGTTEIRWTAQGVRGGAGAQGAPEFPAFSSYGGGVAPGSTGTDGSATFLGPLLAGDESPTVSEARDGGVSVPLPNGRALWLFGDTPQYEFQHGQWNVTHFIHGSSAATLNLPSGGPPTAPLQEVAPGRSYAMTNQPAHQFLPSPRTYLPDGSGRLCNTANGGPNSEVGRWITGAALLPDQTNVLIPYVDVCGLSASNFTVEGWGFAAYNWKSNSFTIPATDVFRPATNGAAIPTSEIMGSPIVGNDKVTLFSHTCCSPGSIYTTTIATTFAALEDPASYVQEPVVGLPPTFSFSVAPPSYSQPHLTMYWENDARGQYRIYTATNPAGPWSQTATGTLPRCDTSRSPCTTVQLHPELSSPSQLLVSYYLPGYGPGIAAHPCWVPQAHLVWASISDA
jgi:hypothetical protein